MLTIRQLEILQVRIPLRLTFRHSLAARSESESVMVRVSSQGGEAGYGEAAPRGYVTGETAESVEQALADELGPPLLGQSFGDFAEVTADIEATLSTLPRNRHAAFCALELALLDLAGKVFGCSAGTVFGPVVIPVAEYSGVISADGREAALRMAAQMKQFGFRQVKVKVGRDADEDLALLRALRDLLGPAAGIRVDANAAWTAEEALGRVEQWAELSVEGIEQPLAADDWKGLAWLTARSPIPIIVDETLASRDDAERLIGERACHAFNLRISKCGGLVNTRYLRDLASRAGIGFQLGAQVGETAILSAAGRHFATRSRGTLFCEGSFGSLLLEEDVGDRDLTFGPAGRAPTLEGPGLGVEVDAGRLSRYVRKTRVIGGV